MTIQPHSIVDHSDRLRSVEQRGGRPGVILFQDAPPTSAFLSLGSVGAGGFDFVVCSAYCFMNSSRCSVTV